MFAEDIFSEDTEKHLQFFGYNAIGLVVSLLLWYFVLPRPPPDDYTTVPGLKDEDGSEESKKAVLAAEDLTRFLNDLHSDFGPIACFYLGNTQVVCVNDNDAIDALLTNGGCCRCALLGVEAAPFSSCPTEQNISVLVERITAQKERLFRSSSNSIAQLLECYCAATGAPCGADNIRQFETRFSELLVTTPRLPPMVVPNPCLAEVSDLLTCLEGLADADGNVFFNKMSREDEIRRAALLCQRLQIGMFGPQLVRFDKEVDIMAHPIPAGTPILCLRSNCIEKRAQELFNNPDCCICCKQLHPDDLHMT